MSRPSLALALLAAITALAACDLRVVVADNPLAKTSPPATTGSPRPSPTPSVGPTPLAMRSTTPLPSRDPATPDPQRDPPRPSATPDPQADPPRPSPSASAAAEDLTGEGVVIPTNAPVAQAGPAIKLSASAQAVAWGVATPADGGVCIALNGSCEVVRVSADGQVARIAGTGANGVEDVQGKPALQAMVRLPMGTAVDANGRLLILDNGAPNGGPRVLRLEADGTLARLWQASYGAPWLDGKFVVGLLATHAGEALLDAWHTKASTSSSDPEHGLWALPAGAGDPTTLRTDLMGTFQWAGFDADGRLYQRRANAARREIVRLAPGSQERTVLAIGTAFANVDQRGNLIYVTGPRGNRQLNVRFPDGRALAVCRPFNAVDEGFVPAGQHQFGGVTADGTVYVVAYDQAWVFPRAVPKP